MKKKWIFAIVLLAVLIAAAALIAVELVKADEQHTLVHADYLATASNLDQSLLTVTENGNPVGTYSLEALGVRSATLAAATGPYSAVDRMDEDAFEHLGIRTRLDWLNTAHPAAQEIAVDMTDYTPAAVLEDLQARRRTPAQDAAVDFADGSYYIVPEQPGTELNLPVVEQALADCVSGMTLHTGAAGAPAAASFELSDVSCYLQPAVTADTIEFDPQALLEQELSDKSLQVYILDDARGLSAAALGQILHADESGALCLDKAPLQETIAKWAQECNKYGTSYLFKAYSGKQVPIDFITVDYKIDEEALLDKIEESLLNLDFSGVEAPELCTKGGEPFAISGTYVEVDIDEQTMTFYKDGKCLVHTSVVTGALDGHQTPTGFYHVENKDTDCWLSGPDYLVFVKYWVGVYGPYGLHDASWRENFGGDFYVYGGSHGCVNTPESAMKKIYDNIEVGDPVLIFGKNQWYEPNT